MQWITKQQLLEREHFFLLDVRTHKQFHDGHLEGAVNFPIVPEALHSELYTLYHRRGAFFVVLACLPHARHFLTYFKTLIALAKKHEKIVIYCSRARFRSKFAYHLMVCFNRQTYILKNGIKGMEAPAFEALCPTCGIEHLFNELEVPTHTNWVHCKKCNQSIQLHHAK